MYIHISYMYLYPSSTACSEHNVFHLLPVDGPSLDFLPSELCLHPISDDHASFIMCRVPPTRKHHSTYPEGRALTYDRLWAKQRRMYIFMKLGCMTSETLNRPGVYLARLAALDWVVGLGWAWLGLAGLGWARWGWLAGWGAFRSIPKTSAAPLRRHLIGILDEKLINTNRCTCLNNP